MLVGIDLGTTNSLIACYKDGKAEIIPNRLGKTLTPSIVAIDENKNTLVGELAREYGYNHPERTARVFKRTMGTIAVYLLGDVALRSEELSSIILRSLKEDAEVYLGCPVDEAIISVPAYFNDNQRSATKRAGELAGLEVKRIISEPTASSIAYGVGSSPKSERCMVFDLGGGTFDVSILEYFNGIVEVHAIAGDNSLGGEDFTNALQNLFEIKNNINREDLDARSLNNLYKASEEAKCAFSENNTVHMSCTIGDKILSADISLKEYELCCLPLLLRLRTPLEKSLNDAKASISDIDRIILVGGATRLPIIREFVRSISGKTPSYCVDPDLSVAIGAALQCGMKQRDKQIKEIILTDVCPFTLGTEVVRDDDTFVERGHYLPIIERNTIIPASRKKVVYTAHDNQTMVEVHILQGESRLARNNLLLGTLTAAVPAGPKGKEAIEITYTYDINSLLEVEVKVLSTGIKKRIVIKNESNSMTDEEVKERLQLLSYLKQNPREEEENYLVLEKGERLYRTHKGRQREAIEQALYEFEVILSEGTRIEIEHKRKKLLSFFEKLDSDSSPLLDDDDGFTDDYPDDSDDQDDQDDL